MGYEGWESFSTPQAARIGESAVTFAKERRALTFNVRAYEAMDLGKYTYAQIEQDSVRRSIRFTFHNLEDVRDSIRITHYTNDERKPRAAISRPLYLASPGFAWFGEFIDNSPESPSFRLRNCGKGMWHFLVPPVAEGPRILTPDEQWAGLAEEEKTALLALRRSSYER